MTSVNKPQIIKPFFIQENKSNNLDEITSLQKEIQKLKDIAFDLRFELFNLQSNFNRLVTHINAPLAELPPYSEHV